MRAPNAYVLICAILCLVGLLTFLIKPGEFRREQKDVGGTMRTLVVPGSFTQLAAEDAAPQTPWHWVQAPIRGFQKAAEVIGFILLVGGAFGVLHATGAILAALGTLTRRVRGAGRFAAIPILMFAFSLGGATFGMSEEVIPFILVIVPLATALRFDTLTGIAIPFVGAGVGFAGAFQNPFTIGVAKGIAGQTLGEGMGYRFLCWFLLTSVAAILVTWRAWRISNGSRPSPTPELDEQWRTQFAEAGGNQARLTTSQISVLIVFLLAMATLAFGAALLDWYISEISGLFLAMAVMAGVLAGLRPGVIADAFVSGARDLAGAAVMVAFARGILVLAEDGKIIDPILESAAGMLRDFGPEVGAQAMFVTHTGINFFMPSGSGQAALTMPVMTPLADLLHMHREQAVLAYQFGDGFSNMIIPTSPVLMGVLATARMPYSAYFRWMLPLQILFFLLGILLLLASPFHLS